MMCNEVAERGEVWVRRTHSIGTCEFLLSGDYCSASLGSVEGSFSTDDSLALRGATFGFTADFGNGVPVISHVGGSGLILVVCVGG